MSGEMAWRAAPASTVSAGPGNCANPATTETKASKADRMDVTLRFSYEATDKIQRALVGQIVNLQPIGNRPDPSIPPRALGSGGEPTAAQAVSLPHITPLT